MKRRDFIKISAALAASTALPWATQAQAALDSLRVIAPAGPGGGWDQTARAIEEVVRAKSLAGAVSVENVPGAGGTIGLAQLAGKEAGDAKVLMVMGLVMVGAMVLCACLGMTIERFAYRPGRSPAPYTLGFWLAILGAGFGQLAGRSAVAVGAAAGLIVGLGLEKLGLKPKSQSSHLKLLIVAIGVSLFYGYGAGWWGQLGAIWILPLAGAIFAFELVLCVLCLRRFRTGPLEWLSRSLAYGAALEPRVARRCS